MHYLDKIEILRQYTEAYKVYQERRASVEEFGGEMVKVIRTITKMSVRKFAVSLNVTPSYLSKVERGLEPISPELAARIVNILDEPDQKGMPQ